MVRQASYEKSSCLDNEISPAADTEAKKKEEPVIASETAISASVRCGRNQDKVVSNVDKGLLTVL